MKSQLEENIDHMSYTIVSVEYKRECFMILTELQCPDYLKII
jgi:hypothetical protein